MDKNDIEVYNRNDPSTWLRPSDDELDIVDIWAGVLRNKKVIFAIWLLISMIGLGLEYSKSVTYKHSILLKTAHYMSGAKTFPITDNKVLKKWLETLYLPKAIQEFHKKYKENGIGKVGIKEVSPSVLEVTFSFNNNNTAKHTELFEILKNIILVDQKALLKSTKLLINANLVQLELNSIEKEGLLHDLLVDKKINLSEKNIKVDLFRKEITSIKKLIEITGGQTATIRGTNYSDALFDPEKRPTPKKDHYNLLAVGIISGLFIAFLVVMVMELNKAAARRAKLSQS